MTSKELAAIAHQILHDPALKLKLCDRIYTLLKQDLRHHQERQGAMRRLR